MKEIPLTQGKVALVDDEDYERLSCYDWKLLKKRSGNLYAIRQNDQTGATIHMHAEVAGAKAGEHVDHKDHDGLNNQKGNLRLCTARQNNQNRRVFKNNKAGFKGVSPSGRKRLPFRAQVRIDGRSTFLGHYASSEAAARAYDAAALKHFGEFACLNFPDRLEVAQ